MPDFAPPPDALAGQLADAWRRLAALDLPRPLAARLHRQLIAVCDAAKTGGADQGSCQRRLAAFVASLEQTAGRLSGHQRENS
jgi:hypothetical protein